MYINWDRFWPFTSGLIAGILIAIYKTGGTDMYLGTRWGLLVGATLCLIFCLVDVRSKTDRLKTDTRNIRVR
jgi:F0F1-type ATP synthase assembly protein I